MSWDLFLTRAINGFGETSWLDWTFLTLCEPDTLWLPGILLGSYWVARWPREALVAAPVMAWLISSERESNIWSRVRAPVQHC